MSDGACCAHQMVHLTPHIHEDGARTDNWRCECGQIFVPGIGGPCVPLERAKRVVEVSYNLGAKDAQRLCAGVAHDEWQAEEAQRMGASSRTPQMLAEERQLTAARIEDEILHLDPTRARPALEVLLAEPGVPCPTCAGTGGEADADVPDDPDWRPAACPDCGGQGLVEVTR